MLHCGSSFWQVPSAACGRARETGCSTGDEVVKPAGGRHAITARPVVSNDEPRYAFLEKPPIPSLHAVSLLHYHCLGSRLQCVMSCISLIQYFIARMITQY